MADRKLQHDLKKRQPFDSPAQEAAIGIMRTSDLLQNRLGRLFREFGLTSSQYNVLRILRGEGKPLPCLEIAERMIQVVPAMTGLVDRLERQGLVNRERSSEDRRVVYISITDKAVAILARIDEPLLQLHQDMLGHLSAQESVDLSRLLEKARTAIG